MILLSFRKKKKAEISKETPGIITEQLEHCNTTLLCDESIKQDDLSKVRKNPELYIEINIISKSRIVDNFFISIDKKSFKYDKFTYNIIDENLYLLPSKQGFFMVTSFFIEKDRNAKSFKKTNKGITGKALSLLYDENLYTDLFSGDENKYNLFIVILSIITLILFSAGLYLLFFYDPSIPPPQIITPVESVILFFRGVLF